MKDVTCKLDIQDYTARLETTKRRQCWQKNKKKNKKGIPHRRNSRSQITDAGKARACSRHGNNEDFSET